MAVAAGWLEGDWIYSDIAEQSRVFWIAENWIWGPVGAADMTTGYWVDGERIWGPAGAPDPTTGFYISKGRIYGPSAVLPFAVRRPGPSG